MSLKLCRIHKLPVYFSVIPITVPTVSNGFLAGQK
jgi:hypothetical protein